jgi:hypothetical protein
LLLFISIVKVLLVHEASSGEKKVYAHTKLLCFIILITPFTLTPQSSLSTLNENQLFSTWVDKEGQKLVVTSATKYNTPLGVRIGANRERTGFSRTLTHKNHPGGLELFPGDQLAQQLDAFIESVEVIIEEDKTDYAKRFASGKDDYFIVYFQRIQLTILHELYQYLLSIYITFNMTNIRNTWDLLGNEMSQALNKKTMIINHLINVIEAQANNAITARFPGLPQHLATPIGPVMMQHDYGADLNQMLEKDEVTFFDELGFDKKDISMMDEQTKALYDYYQKRRTCYLGILGKYLKFFKNYTATLKQDDPKYGTKFVEHAQHIQSILNAQMPQKPSTSLTMQEKLSAAHLQALRDIKTINPPLFFYDSETLRALKIIPKIAKDLPANSKKVSWPSKLVDDAKQAKPMTNRYGNVISTKPPAYFLDELGQQTTNPSSARKLFVNIPTANNMYSQQIRIQPDWLNSADGVLLMLRACLGDYTAILDPVLKSEKILDPCIECIIMNAAQTVGLMNVDQTTCSDCDDYINALKDVLKSEEPITPQPPIELPEMGPSL